MTIDPSWTPLKLIGWTQGHFVRGGVDAPRLTAELLLAHVLGCDRMRLYLDFDKPLGPTELAGYRELIRRRSAGEPTAYLLGHKEFFGRRFRVDPRVLIPRPETELLVEEALRLLPAEGTTAILDLCAGSGCVGITLALERPGVSVVAIEQSEPAVALARENAATLAAPVEILTGDLFAPLEGSIRGEPGEPRFDLIVANPPYIPSGELDGLAREIRDHEPRLALDGGSDGLALTRRIISAAPGWLAPGGSLLVELHEGHGDAAIQLCRDAGLASPRVIRDLAGLPRLLVARCSPVDG
jgi:release factor glutamine methyltransferase